MCHMEFLTLGAQVVNFTEVSIYTSSHLVSELLSNGIIHEIEGIDTSKVLSYLILGPV